jgi:predicted RNA polymerase sigma factor
MIFKGNEYMNKAAFGDTISSYHLEAAIAFEHCITDKFENTNWKRILELYDWLCKSNSSLITEVNRAIVILKLEGASASLAAVKKLTHDKKAESYYLYQSLLGEIYAELNIVINAKTHFEKAILLTKSDKEKKLLHDKIDSLLRRNAT